MEECQILSYPKCMLLFVYLLYSLPYYSLLMCCVALRIIYRSGFYRDMVGPFPDPCMFRITEVYTKLSIEDMLLVTTMNIGPDKPLVERALGLKRRNYIATACL